MFLQLYPSSVHSIQSIALATLFPTSCRMIPLDLARLYVQDLPTWRLKLRLRTGRHYFLALDAPEHELAFLFDRWIRLINMLHGARLSRIPKTTDNSLLETPTEGTLASTWHFQVRIQ